MTSETSETPPARQRRRRYDKTFKHALVEQTLAPGASVARIAREQGINANQLFKWRRQFLLEESATSGAGVPAPSTISLLPVKVMTDEHPPAASSPPTASSTAGQIEIQLAGGTIRIQGIVDKATLQIVLSSLCR